MKSNLHLFFLSVAVFVLGFGAVNAKNILPAGKKTTLSLIDNSQGSFIMKSTVGEITTRTVKTPAGNFVELLVPGYAKSSDIGAPQLPVKRRLIEVPLKAIPKVVILNKVVKEYKLSDYGIDFKVMPLQPPCPKSGILLHLLTTKRCTKLILSAIFPLLPLMFSV